MLRRPISTVLSSLSIGSRLSTRVFCATVTSTNDQIPTVRTTGWRWKRDGTTRNGIYWGEGDPRNRNVCGPSPTDIRGTKLQSILMALEQAQKDGLKQIRVQTDSESNEFEIRRMAIKFQNMEPTVTMDHDVAKFVYCERIVKIMDEIEVILEYRRALFDNKPGNEVFTLLKEDFMKQKDASITVDNSPACQTSANGRITPLSEYSGSTVRTTGFTWQRDGISGTSNGIYWGKDDPRNTRSEVSNDMMDSQGARLRAIAMALEQAMKDGQKRIRVQNDLDIDEMRIRRMALKRIDLSKMRDAHVAKYGYCERIVKIMDEMEVILEFHSPWMEAGNDVMALLTMDYLNTLDTLGNRTVPTVYVRGKRNNTDKVAASASLWVPESIEHLEMNQRPMESIQSLSVYPETHFQAQIMAILKAINEAQALNLSEIQVVTDSLPFVENFSRDWKDANGLPCKDNENLYLEIKALTEKTKVHFKGVRYAKDCDDELLKKVHEMAKEGAGIPVGNKNIVKE